MNAVIGVLGGCGGIGASRFAAALAFVIGRAVLIDIDPGGGGLDVVLGIEAVPGPRWSGLRLAGGHLDPGALAAALPAWGPVAVLAADTLPAAGAVTQVLASARQFGPVVLDLGRTPSPTRDASVAECSLVVLVAGSDLPAMTAASWTARSLPGARLGAVIRARDDTEAARVAHAIGVPFVGRLPALRSRGDGPERSAPPARAMRQVAQGVYDAVSGEGRPS